MILLGGLYFAIPRISGKAWASAFMIRAHWGLSVIGLILVVGGLAWAGLEQGHDLLVPGPAGVFPSFGTIAAHTHRGPSPFIDGVGRPGPGEPPHSCEFPPDALPVQRGRGG